jgi:hypothetical protein
VERTGRTWDTAAAGSFDAGWVRTYQEVRSLDSVTPIQGPSVSAWNESWMHNFLGYAKANNALPDIISWHELGGPGSIADVAACVALEKSLGITPRPISIEEYGITADIIVDGSGTTNVMVTGISGLGASVTAQVESTSTPNRFAAVTAPRSSSSKRCRSPVAR